MSRNVSKFGLINQKLVITLNQIAIWTSICKYYAAKVDLNMNPACAAHLCMNGADARFCLLTLHTEGVALVWSLNEDINILTIAPDLF